MSCKNKLVITYKNTKYYSEEIQSVNVLINVKTNYTS